MLSGGLVVGCSTDEPTIEITLDRPAPGAVLTPGAPLEVQGTARTEADAVIERVQVLLQDVVVCDVSGTTSAVFGFLCTADTAGVDLSVPVPLRVEAFAAGGGTGRLELLLARPGSPSEQDAGVVAADAGPRPDAQVASDAGSGGLDAGTPADTGVTPDAGAARDGGFTIDPMATATCRPLSATQSGLQAEECFGPGMEGQTTEPRPLIVVMHGFTQSVSDLKASTEWHTLAARLGAYVVYPNTGGRAFDWWTADRRRGGRDPASIVALVEKMRELHNIDYDPVAKKGRIYAAGFSAGAYMAVVMIADYPDIFAAGASIAGGPYGCSVACQSRATGSPQAVTGAFPEWWNDASAPKPSLLIVQGTTDAIVNSSNLPALRDQWLGALGLDDTPDNAALGQPTSIDGHDYEIFDDPSTPEGRVATISIQGAGHGVPIDPGMALDQGGRGGTWTVTGPMHAPYVAAQFFGLAP